ncbi:hypothetical protein [Saccharothrix stipae]
MRHLAHRPRRGLTPRPRFGRRAVAGWPDGDHRKKSGPTGAGADVAPTTPYRPFASRDDLEAAHADLDLRGRITVAVELADLRSRITAAGPAPRSDGS